MIHSALNTKLVQLGVALHSTAYRALRGQLPHPYLGRHCLLLETTGRRSGKKRTNPLVFVREGDDYAVVGSWGGSDTHPHWFLNLRADPRVTLNVHGRVMRAVATLVEDQESYDRLWARLVAIYPGYELYRSRTTRKLPIVRLSPLSPPKRSEA